MRINIKSNNKFRTSPHPYNIPLTRNPSPREIKHVPSTSDIRYEQRVGIERKKIRTPSFSILCELQRYARPNGCYVGVGFHISSGIAAATERRLSQTYSLRCPLAHVTFGAHSLRSTRWKYRQLKTEKE